MASFNFVNSIIGGESLAWHLSLASTRCEAAERALQPADACLNAPYARLLMHLPAGIIGLPFALREAGFLMGLILLLGVSGCTLVSVKMLVAMGMREKKLNYEQLAHHVLGKFGYFSVSIAMFLFAYGAMLA